ncbi:MAG: hypothetical protein HRF45_00625 [Fimbriimonadia bacterium]|jgi:hypothetical protein
MKRMRALGILAAAFLVTAVAVAQIDTILKAGGIALAVTTFGKDIDKAINNLTGHKNTNTSTTKVVPILSVGDGGYLGAAQVMGPKTNVDKVQALAQLEGRFMGNAVRLRALIPVSTKTPGKNLAKVDGVAVSAIVDFKL